MEVLLIPVKDDVEVGVAGDLAGVELSILRKDFDFAKLEFEVFHQDGVVAVVLEEHDVSLVLETVCLVADFGWRRC